MAGARDAALFLGGMLVSQAVAFGSGVVVARWLGPADYGVLSIVRNTYGLVSVLAPLGLDLSLLRHLGANAGDWPRLVAQVGRLRRIAGGVNLAALVVVAAFVGPALQHHVFPYPHLAVYLALGFVALPLTADVAILSATFRSLDAVVFQNLAALYVQPLVRAGAILVALLLGFGVAGVVLATAVGLAASDLAMAVALHRTVRRRAIGGRRFDRDDGEAVRSVLRYSPWLAGMLMMALLPRSLDVLVLGWSRPLREVGSYAALSAIAAVVTLAPTAVSQTLAPRVAGRYAAGDLEGARQELARYLRVALLLGSPVFAGLASFGPWLDVVFGPKYRFQPGLCMILSLSAFVSAVFGPMASSLTMTGRHRIEAAWLGVGTIVFVASALLLAPRYGGVGVASAGLAGYLITNIARTVISRSVLGGLDVGWKDAVPPALCLAAAEAWRMGVEGVAPHTAAVGIAAAAGLLAIYAALYGLVLLTAGEKAEVARWWRTVRLA